jgi:F0F1-type ATP synthase assembly protein I
MTGNKNAFFAQVKQLGVLTTIPIILLVGPLIGFVLGGWLDRKVQSYPWFTIAFVSLGFIASAREIIRLLKQVTRDDGTKK